MYHFGRRSQFPRMQGLLSVVLLLLTARKSVAVYWQHGNCIAYLNQTKPFVPNTANHCFIDYSTGVEYCQYSDCPKPPCQKPFHDGHICKTCPGKCQEGERFYDPGAKFLSYDGFRKCQCQRDPGFGAKMFCQVIDKPDPFNFCGIPYPFGYKKGVDMKSAQSFNNGVINNPSAHHNSLNNGGGALQGGVPYIGVQGQNNWPSNPAQTNTIPPNFYPTSPGPVPQASWNNNNRPAVGGAHQTWQNNGGQQGSANNGGGQPWQNNGGQQGSANNGGGQPWQNNGGQQGSANNGGGQQWQNNGNNGGQHNGRGQQWQNNGDQQNQNGGRGWQSNNNHHTTMWPNFNFEAK